MPDTKMRQPFVLRSPNGPNAGKYLAQDQLDDDRELVWTTEISDAARFSVRNAYSLVAAAIDLCCEVIQPENAGDATEEECREFGQLAANDMFQKPSARFVDIFEQWAVRRSAADPLPPMPAEWQEQSGIRKGYMSVWEWFGRAVALRIPPEIT